MDYRQNYESLLQAQCNVYEQMVYAITQIADCDDALLCASTSKTPDIKKVQELTSQKEYYVQKLDALSLETEQAKGRIADILYLYRDFHSHPLYLRMEQLQNLAREQLDSVITKEDKNNPSITIKLTEYKEKLELDIKIREIPQEKRKIFFIRPDK